MPTSGLISSDAYIFKSFLFSVPSAFTHSGPVPYRGLNPFPCRNLPAGFLPLPNLGSEDNLYDPEHRERYGAEKGAETGTTCICMP